MVKIETQRERRNFDGNPISERMINAKKELKGLPVFYRELLPTPGFTVGVLQVRMIYSNPKTEKLVDKIVKKNGGYSPEGWYHPDPQVTREFVPHEAMNGYYFPI